MLEIEPTDQRGPMTSGDGIDTALNFQNLRYHYLEDDTAYSYGYYTL